MTHLPFGEKDISCFIAIFFSLFPLLGVESSLFYLLLAIPVFFESVNVTSNLSCSRAGSILSFKLLAVYRSDFCAVLIRVFMPVSTKELASITVPFELNSSSSVPHIFALNFDFCVAFFLALNFFNCISV